MSNECLLYIASSMFSYITLIYKYEGNITENMKSALGIVLLLYLTLQVKLSYILGLSKL